MNDGFWGTLKSLWQLYPEDRWILTLIALPSLIGSILVCIYLDILSALGHPYKNPFYGEQMRE